AYVSCRLPPRSREACVYLCKCHRAHRSGSFVEVCTQAHGWTASVLLFKPGPACLGDAPDSIDTRLATDCVRCDSGLERAGLDSGSTIAHKRPSLVRTMQTDR